MVSGLGWARIDNKYNPLSGGHKRRRNRKGIRYAKRFCVRKANNNGIGKIENQTRFHFPFVVLKPPQGCGFSRSVQQRRKKRAFRGQHFTAAASPRITGHGSPPNLGERMLH